MIGWNISRRFAVMDHDEQRRLAAVGRLGRFAIDINGDVDQYAIDTGLAGFDLPDPIAMAVALDDSIIVESTDEWLVVGLDGPTRGCTIPDRRHGRPDSEHPGAVVRRRGRIQTAPVRGLRRLIAGPAPPRCQRGSGRSPGLGPSVRVRLSSKNESTSIIVTRASHIATLCSVLGILEMIGPK